MAHILARFPARIGHSPPPDELTVAWDTGTWLAPAAARQLPAGSLNGLCLDISKTTVDRLWAESAGYSISVDPLVTEDRLVVKPDRNGERGGRVVAGPLRRRRPGFVYQLLVDSRSDDGRVLQLRYEILCATIILGYAKWRPYLELFAGTELTLPTGIDEYVSANEQAMMVRFAAAIGMDYGELDAIRDRHSRRLYVVDANRTPVRPKGLPVDREDDAFGPQAEAVMPLLAAAQSRA